MIIIKRFLSLGLSLVLALYCFITPFLSVEADLDDGNMIITPITVVTLSNSVTSLQRDANWTKTGGDATISAENGVSTVVLSGKKGTQLFTNTFTLTKNNTYRFSFEVKIGSETKLSNTYNDVSQPSGIDFVLQDFGSLDKKWRCYIHTLHRGSYRLCACLQRQRQ